MNDNLIFETKSNKVSIEFLYEVGGYYTYHISVMTNGFAGRDSFCIDKDTLRINIETIQSMINSLCGECEIRDGASDAYIRIYFEDSMTFYICGELGGSHNDNVLKFKFQADQTLLYGLKRNLLG